MWLKIISKTVKITSDSSLLLQFFEATMNLAPIGALHIFGNQYIMGIVLSCSVILRSILLQYLVLVSINSSLDFCVCKYGDVEFLLLFEVTSVNIFKM